MEVGYCLGSEGNGISLEEGSEGGPGPPGCGKDKQSVLNEGRDNMGKDEEDQPSRRWWRRIGANRVSGLLNKLNFVTMIAELILTLCFFFQENKSYGVQKPFALILCLPTTVQHVANSSFNSISSPRPSNSFLFVLLSFPSSSYHCPAWTMASSHCYCLCLSGGYWCSCSCCKFLMNCDCLYHCCSAHCSSFFSFSLLLRSRPLFADAPGFFFLLGCCFSEPATLLFFLFPFLLCSNTVLTGEPGSSVSVGTSPGRTPLTP